MAWNFLRGDEKPGGGVFGFLNDVHMARTPVQKKGRELAVGAARSIARIPETAVRSGLQIGAKIGGDKGDFYGAPAPTDPIRRFLYGSEPIETYQKRGAGIQKATGIPAPLAAIGLLGLDLPGPGSLGKSGSKEIIEQLVKETTESGVKNILKKTGTHYGDDVIKAISKSTDTNAIKNILSGNKSQIVKEAQQVIPPPVKPPKDIVEATIPKVETTLESPATRFSAALRGQFGNPPVKGAPKLLEEQAGLYTAERQARLGKAFEAGKGLSGEEAIAAQLKGLGKGELPKVNPEKLVKHVQNVIDEQTYLDTLKQIQTSDVLKGYDKITVPRALRDFYRDGKMLQPAQLEKLDRVAPGLGDAISSTATSFKAKTSFKDWLGLPKALRAAGDLGGMFRQGILPIARFPKEWGSSLGVSVKSFFSAKAAEKATANLKTVTTDLGTPLEDLMRKAKLDVITIKKFREEAFPTKLAEKIPGVKNSDRSFELGLSTERAKIFGHIMNDLEKAGHDLNNLPVNRLKSIGDWVNNATGRADLKTFGNLAPAIREALFSAKLWKSRLNLLNLNYYRKLDPIARKYALQSAGSFAALAGSILGLAAVAGADIETDPRSSDFLKVKIGDTRFDILGGFQQNLVFAWREIKGEKKSSQTGKVAKLSGEDKPYKGANRLSILADLVQGKESPAISTAQTLIEGEDKAGNPVNPLTEIGKLGVPLSVESLYGTVRNRSSSTVKVPGTSIELPRPTLKEAGKAVGLSSPEFLGISGQTYGLKDINISKKQKEYISKLPDKNQQEAYTRFLQTAKTGPDRDVASKKIKAVLTNPDGSVNEAGIQKAVEIGKKYNEEYKKAFAKWRERYGKYAKDEALIKQYRSGLFTDDSIDSYISIIEKGPSL